MKKNIKLFLVITIIISILIIYLTSWSQTTNINEISYKLIYLNYLKEKQIELINLKHDYNEIIELTKISDSIFIEISNSCDLICKLYKNDCNTCKIYLEYVKKNSLEMKTDAIFYCYSIGKTEEFKKLQDELDSIYIEELKNKGN